MDYFGFIILLFFSGFVVLGLIAYGKEIWMGFQSKNWPHTVGHVVSAEVEKKRSTFSDEHGTSTETTYTAKVAYKYSVSGRSYRGENIAFGYESIDKYDAEKMVARYRDSNQVTVYYNPDDPSQAVLEPGTRYAVSLGLLIVIVLAVFIIIGWFIKFPDFFPPR